ncbi:MAG: GerMN domain-containing protein [Patescibacteria group bacterium]|nr:GerMN domain-containing protein [Patescibacteria group bacterium]
MNQSSVWKWIIAVVVIILAIWGLRSLGGNDNFADQAISIDETTELVVSQPLADDVIESPLTVEGQALGSWFFEGQFALTLIDGEGEVLGETLVLASLGADNEMGPEAMVPFDTIMLFGETEAGTGHLIFEPANPERGEDQLFVKLPVRFGNVDFMIDSESIILDEDTSGESDVDADASSVVVTEVTDNTGGVVDGDASIDTSLSTPPAPGMIKLKTYLARASDVGVNCSQVVSSEREVPQTVRVGTAALKELLAGPNSTEISAGLVTTLPAGVGLSSLTINNGVARADFSAGLNNGATDVCRTASIRAQITETLKQFSTVQSVIISVDGNAAAALQLP